MSPYPVEMSEANYQWSEEFKPQARLENVEEDDEMDME
jgi:hypothetical protein